MTVDSKAQAALVAPGFPFRLAAFGVATVVLYQGLYAMLQGDRGAWVSAENGLVEILQVLLAVAASALLFLAARRAHVGQAAMTLGACVTGYAAARESDSWLESLFFDDAYKYLVGLPLALIAVVVLYRQRRRLIDETLWLMNQPPTVMFILAGIYLGGVCQIFDRPGTWIGLASPDQAVAAKATIEEFSELFAYLLFAFSAWESYLATRAQHALPFAAAEATTVEPAPGRTL